MDVHFRDLVEVVDGASGSRGRGRAGLTNVGEILARHLACFGDLPDADREALATVRAEIRDVPRLQDVLSEGDRPDEVIVVLSGLLYRYTIAPDGQRQIHSFYVPSEAPSLESLYLDYMDNALGAVVDSRIGAIPHADLYRIVDERPEARKLMWRQTLVQSGIFRTWLMRNSNLPAPASLAHFLCEMFVRLKAAGLVTGNCADLPLTQEFVADALGLTAVHTNRTLRVLRETGAVELRSGRLTVHDWARLREIADYDDRYLHLRCG